MFFVFVFLFKQMHILQEEVLRSHSIALVPYDVYVKRGEQTKLQVLLCPRGKEGWPHEDDSTQLLYQLPFLPRRFSRVRCWGLWRSMSVRKPDSRWRRDDVRTRDLGRRVPGKQRAAHPPGERGNVPRHGQEGEVPRLAPRKGVLHFLCVKWKCYRNAYPGT